jgi:hypothetical protein
MVKYFNKYMGDRCGARVSSRLSVIGYYSPFTNHD